MLDLNNLVSCSSPALYEKYLTAPNPAVDEWTLSENMAADTAGGGLAQMEEHYKTFIVRAKPARTFLLQVLIFLTDRKRFR